jgi:hypothetical protein
MRFELKNYRTLRGHISGILEVVKDNGEILFADEVALSNAKARNKFAQALLDQLNGQTPQGLDVQQVEQELLKLYKQAEAALRTDPQPSAPAVAEDEERVETYIRSPQGMFEVQTRETVAGPVEVRVQLANFQAEIIEDVTIDDGADTRRIFVIKGQLGGQPLPTIRVDAANFASMGWVTEKWGAQTRIAPRAGRRDVLRDAIQAFSTGARQRMVYAHIGWRKVDGHWLYLHGNGGIGASGIIESVEVELEGQLSHYRLPAPPTGQALVEAVRASWNLWDVATAEVSATFLGAVYAAPLSEWLCPDFSLWAVGHTGKLKTSYAALVTSHFGHFDHKSVPASWEDTANALEKLSFAVKDAIFLIDDFRPPADRIEAAEMRRKAARLVRSAGNRTGRQRMAGDTSLRPIYYPRGIIISTAEEQVAGESAAARRWELPFDESTVNRALLTTAQGRTELLRAGMAGYIQWLAQRLEREGSDWLSVIQRQIGQKVIGIGGHLRHAQTLATLLTGWLVFMEFGQSVGAVSPADVEERLGQVEEALRKAAEMQRQRALDVRPECIFLETLHDLLAQEKAYLAGLDGGPPPEPQNLGWSHTGTNSLLPPLSSEKLGWANADFLYLIPNAAHRLVAKALSERGESFVCSARALRGALKRAGFLVPGNRTRELTSTIRAEGKTVRVLPLHRKRVQKFWEERL